MKRLNLYLPDVQYDWLEQQSKEQGISAAEIMRRALDAWMKSQAPPREPLFKRRSLGTAFLGAGGLSSGALIGSIQELQYVVTLLERALRETASRDTMAIFDAELDEYRKKSSPLPTEEGTRETPATDDNPS